MAYRGFRRSGVERKERKGIGDDPAPINFFSSTHRLLADSEETTYGLRFNNGIRLGRRETERRAIWLMDAAV